MSLKKLFNLLLVLFFINIFPSHAKDFENLEKGKTTLAEVKKRWGNPHQTISHENGSITLQYIISNNLEHVDSEIKDKFFSFPELMIRKEKVLFVFDREHKLLDYSINP